MTKPRGRRSGNVACYGKEDSCIQGLMRKVREKDLCENGRIILKRTFNNMMENPALDLSVSG
jgi:hypothetical protein